MCLLSVAVPASTHCMKIVWMKTTVGWRKRETKMCLKQLWVFMQFTLLTKVLNHYFMSAALTGITNRTFWTCNWCQFIWNIQFQTELLSLTYFFGNRRAGINVTVHLLIIFAGLKCKYKTFNFCFLVFLRCLKLFPHWPFPLCHTFRNDGSRFHCISLLASNSFNSKSSLGITEKHTKQQLNLCGM